MLLRVAKAIVIVAVLFGACLPGSAAPLDRAYSPIEFNGGTAKLAGPWKFHLGDNSAWKSADFDDKSWEGLSGDKSWGAQGHSDTYGFAWYRLHIVPGPSAPPELAVLFPTVEDAYEVYWNGQFVGSYGKLPPRPEWYQSLWSETFGLGRTGEGVLAVRVWKAPFWYGPYGGFDSAPILGSPEAVAQAKAALDFEWLRDSQYIFGTISLLGLIFVIGVIGWFRDRRQWVLLWMAIFAFVPCGALLLLMLKIFRDPFAFVIFQLIGTAGEIALILLLLWLLDLKDDARLVRVTSMLCLADAIAGILKALFLFGLQNPEPAMIGGTILQGLIMAFDLFPLYLIALALKRKRQHLDHSRWLVAISGTLVLLVTTFGSILTLAGLFFHKDLSGVIWTPIAVVWGNPIQPLFVATPICLLTVFYSVYRYSAVNRRRQIALEEEFKSAREIQSVLIPEILPKIPGIAITSSYKPAREVGGDFFQVLPLENGSVLIVIGDVSGKGLKAAMSVSLIVGVLRALVRENTDPAELLAALNRSVHGQLQGGFATCIVLRVDAGGMCVFVNAGHPAPFLNGRELPSPGALPVGIMPEATYEDSRFAIAPGDHLALYTDGLLEARNGAGDLYGFERVQTLLSSKPTAAAAVDAAVAFGQDDDITVLTLARLPINPAASAEWTGNVPLQEAY
jgi:Stage II sporulation protein E (SpoIIE)